MSTMRSLKAVRTNPRHKLRVIVNAMLVDDPSDATAQTMMSLIQEKEQEERNDTPTPVLHVLLDADGDVLATSLRLRDAIDERKSFEASGAVSGLKIVRYVPG